MPLVPENLTILGRAALCVIGIELLTSTTGMAGSIAQVVNYVQDHSKNSTDAIEGDEPASLKTLPVLIFSLTLSSLFLLFNFALYYGMHKSQTYFLNIWYRFNQLCIIFIAIMSIFVAFVNPTANFKGVGSPDLVVRVFEVWIIHEYMMELEDGYGRLRNERDENIIDA